MLTPERPKPERTTGTEDATALSRDGATTAPEELEALELELLLAGVARRWGYDFRDYAPAALRRRVRKAMEMENVGSLSALQERLLHHADAVARFVATMTIPVGSMFRDPEVFRGLRRLVVPLLAEQPFARIWHAGCANGAEVYSLVILLLEEGILDRCRVYATDMSDEALQQARRGVFPLQHMRNYTAAYHQSGGARDFSSYYTADHQNAILHEDLRRNVLFSRHDLASGGAFNEFHLIVCRNVMLSFAPQLRDRVHGLFCDSLAPGGVLVVGMHETLRYSPFAHRYDPLAEGLGIYRRMH